MFAYKTLHRKQKIEQHECERRFSGRVNSSCSTSDSCYKPRDFKLVRFLTSIFYRTMLAFAHFFTCSNKHSTSSNHKRSHSCCSIFSFLCSVLYIIVFILSFFFWPLYCLSVVFTAFDCPFGIFKSFLNKYDVFHTVLWIILKSRRLTGTKCTEKNVII
jgi:hypothetical protein